MDIRKVCMEARIDQLTEENAKLKELCDKYEEEHKTVFERWKKDIKIIDELQKEIDRLNNECDTYMKIATNKQYRINSAMYYIELDMYGTALDILKGE